MLISIDDVYKKSSQQLRPYRCTEFEAEKSGRYEYVFTIRYLLLFYTTMAVYGY